MAEQSRPWSKPVEKLRKGCESNTTGILCGTDLYRCTQCPSEYQVLVTHSRNARDGKHLRHVDWDDHRKNLPWIVEIERFLDLGRCMSPNEPEWRALQAPALEAERHRTLSPVKATDTIEYRFNTARGDRSTQQPAYPLF